MFPRKKIEIQINDLEKELSKCKMSMSHKYLSGGKKEEQDEELERPSQEMMTSVGGLIDLEYIPR